MIPSRSSFSSSFSTFGRIANGIGLALMNFGVDVDYRKYFPTLPLDSTSVTLKTYSGEKIFPEGVMHVNVQYNNQRVLLC
jgi:hypothetical protein